jgi:hypothetical protein
MSIKIFVELKIRDEKLDEVQPLFSSLLHETPPQRRFFDFLGV